MAINDIEYWRNQYNEAKNDWNFLQLCNKMNYGDAIWYVEEQKIFDMNFGNEPLTMYKPLKLILAGKFSCEGSQHKSFVFIEPNKDYLFNTKYIWADYYRENDILHPGIGLCKDRTIALTECIDFIYNKRTKPIQLYCGRYDSRVFLDEESCLKICKKLNSYYDNKEKYKIAAKNLRIMQRKLKEDITKYM